ncbi:DUF418 domain-containing protein [Saccharopolyspora sp. NPDC047091]|uniref:DUF418 domain-containing protein n=1 Tax=Saccharopolyspora sp. NPDC047091 TaxID=3155924 RepID=UPI0033C5BF53
MSIDVIRGVAIAGILLINITYFLRLAGWSEVPGGSDAVLWKFVDLVALGKFHFVFAFLFGTSAFLFLSRLRAKERSLWAYSRRMIILILAGVLNSALGGIDVLMSYGVLAFVLLLLTFLPRTVLVTVGVVASLVPDFLRLTATLGAGDAGLPPQLTVLFEFARTSGHMALGFWAAERGLFEVGTRLPVKIAFWVTAACSVPIWVWTLLAGSDQAHDIAFRTAAIPGLMYVTGLVLALRHPGAERVLSFLRFYGRMAFSNYLGQTVICTTVLPLFVTSGHLSALAALGFCLAVIVLQSAFSAWWLRRFRQGPLEWAWRCGTYWEFTPLRAGASRRA